MVRSELKCFRLASMVEGKSDWDVSGSCSDSTTSLSLQIIIFQKIFIPAFSKSLKRCHGKKNKIYADVHSSCVQHKHFVFAFRGECLMTITTVFAENFVICQKKERQQDNLKLLRPSPKYHEISF